MYQKQVDPAAFITAHATGLKDRELAAHFDISLATVKRRRKDLNLGSNCLSNNKGQLGERLVAEFLRREGLTVTRPTQLNAPFDLLVNGLRVDVKVGLRRPQSSIGLPSYQFRLPPLRSSFHASKLYAKDYQRDTDFIVLAVLEGATLTHCYVLPVSHWKATITVTPGSWGCQYQAFLDTLENFQVTAPLVAA